MSFNDIFKSSFLERTASFSLPDTIVALALAFALGMFIYFVYKKTYQGVVFSRSFGVSLVALTMIGTFIILAVTSNVVLSLGMVGALSIVRFRTAIKDPLDIVYLFWSIAVGIVLGAGMWPLAVIGSLIVGAILLVFVNAKSSDCEYIVVVECENDAAENKAVEIIKESTKKSALKSKTVKRGYIEITYEVRLGDNTSEFVNKLSDTDGVDKAVLVSYNGDYMA